MSDAIKDIANVLKDALVTPVQEAFVYRARNPFFGTLVISWFFYNWDKVAYFFLSKNDVLERIYFIRHKIPDNSIIFGHSISHTHSVWFPITWSIFISITYPFFTYGALYIHKWITSEIEIVSTAKEKERLKRQKDLVVEIAINESARAKQLANDEAEIEETKERAIKAKMNISSLRDERNTLMSQIESFEMQKSTLEKITSDLNENLKRINDGMDGLTERHGSFSDLENKYSLLEAENLELKEHLKNSKYPALAKTINRGTVETIPVTDEATLNVLNKLIGKDHNP